MRKRLIDIIVELKEIVSEGKCSIELANKIEAELDDLFEEDDAIQDFVSCLARYRPNGGEYLLDINDIVKECRFIIDILEMKLHTLGCKSPDNLQILQM